MADSIDFTLNGTPHRLSRREVEASVRDTAPEDIVAHAVVVEGRRFPVKQVFAAATGLDRQDFTTNTARRLLIRLGFEAVRVMGR